MIINQMATIEDRVEVTAAMLLEAVREAGMAISGDMRVSEADAAALLAYSPSYLRQLRGEGKGPEAYGLGMNGARISYRIRSLAEFIESRRENFDASDANDG